MTHKMLLLGRPTGAVYGLPKRFLDARRPFDAAATVVEGLVPYHPALPVVPQLVANYNQTVARLAGLRTAGTGLESTSLYFAFGLDLHAGRVHPSKKFDVLNADFGYATLAGSLVGLAVGVAWLARLAHRHTLEGLWA